MESVATLLEAIVLYDSVYYDPSFDWEAAMPWDNEAHKLLGKVLTPCEVSSGDRELVIECISAMAISWMKDWGLGYEDEAGIDVAIRHGSWGKHSALVAECLKPIVGEANVDHIIRSPHPHIIGYDLN